jgi:hypothetical protein
MASPAARPLPDYDQLSLGDLQHRIRSLNADQLQAVTVYECAHAARVPVLEVLEARRRQLEDGAEPSPGDPSQQPRVEGNKGGSKVQQATAAEANTPLRHGVAQQTPNRGLP